eukprot:Nk52_evm1s449 gene=Nk52_evmTU1s449
MTKSNPVVKDPMTLNSTKFSHPRKSNSSFDILRVRTAERPSSLRSSQPKNIFVEEITEKSTADDVQQWLAQHMIPRELTSRLSGCNGIDMLTMSLQELQKALGKDPVIENIYIMLQAFKKKAMGNA